MAGVGWRWVKPGADTGDVTTPALTRFGSSLATPRSAAAVLRARASNHGVILEPADDCDLAAAAIGADLWLLANHAVDLDHSAGTCPGAPAALAKVLLRAAGRAIPGVKRTGPPPPLSNNTVIATAVSAYLTWAESHLGEQGTEAMRRAGEDLSSGEMTSVAEVLILAAEAADLLRAPE